MDEMKKRTPKDGEIRTFGVTRKIEETREKTEVEQAKEKAKEKTKEKTKENTKENTKEKTKEKTKGKTKAKTVLSGISTGSYTVEAAFVVPILIFVLLALIYMSFYLYDKVRIQSVIDTEAAVAAGAVKHERNPETGDVEYEHLDDRGLYFSMFGDLSREEEKTKERVRAQLEHGLFLCEVTGVEVNLDRSQADIRVFAHANIRMLKIREYFAGSGTDLVLMATGKVHYPAEFARRLSMLDGIEGEKKKYEQTRQSLQKKIDGK